MRGFTVSPATPEPATRDPVAASRPPLPPSTRVGGVLRSGWLPAATTVAFVTLVLLGSDVSASDLAAFATYVGLGLTLPGALLWRLAHGGARSLAEDCAAGTVVGYAGEVLLYLPARAVGVPYLTLLFPAAVIATFALAPNLRRFWRGRAESARLPLWVAWSLSVSVIFVVAWSAATFFRGHGLTWPGNASPYVDMPFHLALVGELREHVPPAVPYLLDEPLRYHWFVYAEMASASWVTGIDPQTLIFRLALLPMLAAATVLVAVIAVRVSGRWWTGPAAVAMTYLSCVANPYPWAGSSFFDSQNLNSLWTSPTHAFGLTLFLGAVLQLIDLLDPRAPATPVSRHGAALSWGLFALLIAAVMGAKATFLPMLVAGLLTVLLGDLLLRRRPSGRTFAALVVTVGALLIAQVVLFGGSDGASQLAPFATTNHFSTTALTGLTASPATAKIGALVAVTALAVLGWAMQWAGVFGLATTRQSATDRRVLLLLGLCVSAFAVLLMLDFPGWSQAYFLRGAGPFLAVLSVTGLAAAVGRAGSARSILAAVSALGVGAATAVLVRVLGPAAAPTLANLGHVRRVVIAIALPWLALVAVLAVGGVALFLARWRWPWLTGMALFLTLVVAMGFGLPQTWSLVGPPFADAMTTRWQPTPLADGGPEINRDELTAAQWLHANSEPRDLVATNAHCLEISTRGCDSRHFWISAYTQRRVLVEGWAYTATANDISVRQGVGFPYVRFWRTELLQQNDAVFTAPSRAAVQRLGQVYGVRWLFADSRWRPVSTDLAKFAVLRFQTGQCRVYEIVG